MFNHVKVIECGGRSAANDVAALHERLTEIGPSLPFVRQSLLGMTLPRALNGGHLIWRLTFDAESDYLASSASIEWQSQVLPYLSPTSHVLMDEVGYTTGLSHTSVGRDEPGIWRCLIFAVDVNCSSEQVRQLERELLAMPNLVRTICNWALSRVTRADGQRRWTHMWEQEFDSIEGLDGEYMTHPIHWGLVDGWFDPECPQRIVDPWLIHAAIPITGAVITS